MMTDREALLQAILDSRDENVPRLIYADWLEENRTSDADTATVEFIRASCGENGRRDGSAWLEGNWQRLVPTFLNKWCRRQMFGTDYHMSRNTKRPAAIAAVWYSVNRELRTSKAWLYFDRGFVSRLWSPSYHVLDKTPPSLAKDQPLLNLLALPATARPQLLRDRKHQTEFVT